MVNYTAASTLTQYLVSFSTSANPHCTQQSCLRALEVEKVAAERRATSAEREVANLKRQLADAMADAEEAVQNALAEAHEAFDAEV